MNCCNRPTTTTQKELKSGLSLYRAAAAAAEIIMMALVMMMMNDVKKKKRKKARCASPSPGWPGKRKAACVLPPDDDDGHNGTMMKNTARRGSMDSSLGCGGLSGRIVSMRARARPWRSTISCPPVYKHVQHQRRHRDGGHEYSSPVHIPLLLFSSVWSPFFV